MTTIKFSKDYRNRKEHRGDEKKKPSESLPCFKLRKLGGFRGHSLS